MRVNVPAFTGPFVRPCPRKGPVVVVGATAWVGLAPAVVRVIVRGEVLTGSVLMGARLTRAMSGRSGARYTGCDNTVCGTRTLELNLRPGVVDRVVGLIAAGPDAANCPVGGAATRCPRENTVVAVAGLRPFGRFSKSA